MTSVDDEPVKYSYFISLDGLNETHATYTHPGYGPNDEEVLTLTIPRDVWENMGRPGKIDMHMVATQPGTIQTRLEIFESDLDKAFPDL